MVMLKDNHSPEWLLRLPMTKAVVKAMDAVTCIKIDEFCINNDEFCILNDEFCIKTGSL